MFLSQKLMLKMPHSVVNDSFVMIVLNSDFIGLGGHNRQKVHIWGTYIAVRPGLKVGFLAPILAENGTQVSAAPSP